MLLFLSDEYNGIKLAFICAVFISLMSLPALWTALSNKHWFFRLAAVLAGALLVLAMRAYDLTVVYFFYSAVVVVILSWAKRFRRWREKSLPTFQYSLKDLFLLMILSGVLAVIVSAMMRDDFFWSWITHCSAALGMSVLALSLAWLRFGKRHVAIRSILFLAAWAAVVFLWNQKNSSGFYVILSSNLIFFEKGLTTVFYQFDILPDFLRLSSLLFSLGYGLLVAAFFFLWISAAAVIQNDENLPTSSGKRRTARSWAARISLLLLILCLTPDAGFVYWRLAKPLPAMSEESAPNPNGYDHLVKVGKKLELVIIPLDESLPPATFASFVKTHAAELDEIREGLARPIRAPLPLSQKAYNQQLPNVAHLRQLARGLMSESIHAAQEKRFNVAAESALDCIELGAKTPRGGLLTEALVGIAITRIGTYSLKKVRGNLDVQECREILQKLIKLESHREPLEAMFRRDSLWEKKFNPWEMRLETAVQSAPFKESLLEVRSAAAEARRHQDVELELLKTELALRIFKLETGDFPQQLTQLVSEYLPSVPLDLCSRNRQPLVYRPHEESFLLYSVWRDGKDNGGVRGTMQDIYSYSVEGFDYFLDPLPDPPPGGQPQNGPPLGK